LIKEKS